MTSFGGELVKHININNSLLNIIVRNIISVSIDKTFDFLNEKLSSFIARGTWTSLTHTKYTIYDIYRRINCAIFNTPMISHYCCIKLQQGSCNYNSVVHTLINEHKVSLRYPVTFAETNTGGLPDPIMSAGEHFIIEYKNKKINVLTFHVPKPQEKDIDNSNICVELSINDVNGPVILREFIIKCTKVYNDNSKGVQVYTNHRDNYWYVSKSIPEARSIETVILRNDLQYKIMEDIKFFVDNIQWFTEKGLPHKLGILFYGVPGTGKSSMINVIASMTKRNIYYVILDNIKNDESFLCIMQQTSGNDIIVIEDVDRTQLCETETGRKPTISFSTVLNSLDGLLSSSGRMIIFTANNPDLLDPAFLRPGRIDHKYHLGKCDTNQINKIHQYIYGHSCPSDILSRVSSDIYTPAEIITHFIRHLKDPENIFTDEEFECGKVKVDNHHQ